MSLLDHVLARLHDEFCAAEKRGLFETLKASVWGEKTDTPYQQIAAQFGTTEGAIKVKAHRMRERYRELLREEVAQTVASPAEVDEELRYLASILRS